VGDVITKINGGFVVNAQTLPSLVAEHQPGTTVTVDYLRKGMAYQTKIVLGDLDNPNKSFIYPTQSQVGSLDDQQGQVGIDVRDLEASDRVSVKLGVYVSAVHAESIAAVVGLKRGDVITAINGEKISTVKDFKKILKNLTTGAIIKLDVARGNTVLYFAFKK
jgi:serine protease Do